MTSVESKLSEALKDHFRIYFPSRETVEKSIGGLGVSKVLGLPSTSSTSYRSQFSCTSTYLRALLFASSLYMKSISWRHNFRSLY
jgi:hypothetical protein